MGYSTDFYGSFKLSRKVTKKEKNYINLFSSTRRMKRDVNKLMELYKGKHGLPHFTILNDEQKELVKKLEDTGLKVSCKNKKDTRTPSQIYGNDGEYFAMDDKQSGQTRDNSIIDYNQPAGQLTDRNLDFNYMWNENQKKIAAGTCQPGLWCQWVISDDSKELEWNGGEKFYYYIEWLQYMINHFFQPWNIKLNGEVTWEGEDSSDMGKIILKDNIVTVKQGKITYE
jgi:hypothetical protein